MKIENLESCVEHTIGGGWGVESPDLIHSERVAIIRGTDIPKLQIGIFSSVPLRYESFKKVQSRKLEEGDLVIEISGGSAASNQYTGRTLVITKEIIDRLGGVAIPASFCRLLRLDKNKIDPWYVSYQIDLMHSTGEISEYEVQSTGISNFQYSHFLENFSPYLSDLNDQKRAAEVITTIDKKIAALRSANESIYRIVFGLYRSWFVNFDPVEVDLNKALSGQIKFPKVLEHDAIGPIPAGWRRAKFKEMLDDVIGGDWGSDIPTMRENEQITVVRGTDLPDLRNNITSKLPVRYTTSKKIASRFLREGDIVIEVSGGSKDQPTGRSFLFTDTYLKQFYRPVVPASFCRRMRPINLKFGIFLYCHLSEIYRQGKMWEYQVQSTGISNFQMNHFLDNEILAIPTEEILNKFFDIAYPLLQKAGHSEIQDLTRLRNILLPKVIMR